MSRNFGAGVTVFAIDLVLSRMQLVRERQWLIGHVALIVADDDFVIGEGPYEYRQAYETKNDDGTDDLFHWRTLCEDIQCCTTMSRSICAILLGTHRNQ